MSVLITLAELRLAIEGRVPALCSYQGNDFTDLANRAVRALYNKVPLSGMLDRQTLTATNGIIELNTENYSHILSFKVDDCTVPIVPVVDVWKIAKAGYNSFVDLGFNKQNLSVRQYELPECLKEDSDDHVITALIKVRYVDLVAETDSFQVASISAIKNAMVATMMEDNSDGDSAFKYWQIATQSGVEENRDFNGPIVPSISFHDPALTDATQSIV